MIDNSFSQFKFSFFQYLKYKAMGCRKCLLNLKMSNSNICMSHSTMIMKLKTVPVVVVVVSERLKNGIASMILNIGIVMIDKHLKSHSMKV